MKIVYMFALMISMSFGSVASANLITNGSFESGPDIPENPGYLTLVNTAPQANSITGWTVVLSSIDYIGTYWVASHGSRSLDINGNFNGGIQQAFATTIGTTYNVRFDMAGNPDMGSESTKIINVSVNGGVGSDYSFTTPGGTLEQRAAQRANMAG